MKLSSYTWCGNRSSLMQDEIQANFTHTMHKAKAYQGHLSVCLSNHVRRVCSTCLSAALLYCCKQSHRPSLPRHSQSSMYVLQGCRNHLQSCTLQVHMLSSFCDRQPAPASNKTDMANGDEESASESCWCSCSHVMLAEHSPGSTPDTSHTCTKNPSSLPFPCIMSNSNSSCGCVASDNSGDNPPLQAYFTSSTCVLHQSSWCFSFSTGRYCLMLLNAWSSSSECL